MKATGLFSRGKKIKETKEPKKNEIPYPNTFWGQVWYFVWYDNSIWSWIFDILLAFVIIKFMVYPLLGFFLGTQFPVVAVVSGSMDHDLNPSGEICGKYPLNYAGTFNNFWNTCGGWYDNKGITRDQFLEFDFKNGFSKGDIIILKGKDPQAINTGDVIVFKPGAFGEPVIHRVVGKTVENDHAFFQTKGDHNKDTIYNAPVNEGRISETRILGKAWFKIPWLGYLKIGFVNLIQTIRGS